MASKKFSVGDITEPVTFEIDEDSFEAIAANRFPAGAMAKYFDMVNGNKLFEAQNYFFKTVLTKPSQKTFFDRMDSPDKPITVKVLGDVAAWLLGEVYMAGEATEESKPS